jgi:hypothetical protein
MSPSLQDEAILDCNFGWNAARPRPEYGLFAGSSAGPDAPASRGAGYGSRRRLQRAKTTK